MYKVQTAYQILQMIIKNKQNKKQKQNKTKNKTKTKNKKEEEKENISQHELCMWVLHLLP